MKMFQRHAVSRTACIVVAATFGATLAGGSVQTAGAVSAPTIVGNWKAPSTGKFEAVELGESDTYAFISVSRHFKPLLSQCSVERGTHWAVVSGTGGTYRGTEDVSYVFDSKAKQCVATSTAPVTIVVEKHKLVDSIGSTTFETAK
jgi:hypothetical protein